VSEAAVAGSAVVCALVLTAGTLAPAGPAAPPTGPAASPAA
jgi:hypothetical protein